MTFLLLLILTGCPSTDAPSTTSGPNFVTVHACLVGADCEKGVFTEMVVNTDHVIAVSPVLPEVDVRFSNDLTPTKITSMARAYIVLTAGNETNERSGPCHPINVPLKGVANTGLCLKETVPEVLGLLSP